jgi:hypothetical protein
VVKHVITRVNPDKLKAGFFSRLSSCKLVQKADLCGYSYDKLLSSFAFNFNLRRYTTVVFTPYDQNNVGLYDTANGTFKLVAATGASYAAAGAYTRPLSGST